MNPYLKYKGLNKYQKKEFNTIVGSVFSFIWGFIEIIMGIYLSSLFLIFSALFSIALGLSKYFCIKGLKKDSDSNKTIYVYNALLLIILAGALYSLSSLKLLLGFTPTNYGIIIAITIALVSFTKMTLAIIDLFRYKKSNIYYNILKTISFLSALTQIMLTQMSLLIVCDPKMNQYNNVLFAFAIGLFAIIIGFVLLISNKKAKNKDSL